MTATPEPSPSPDVQPEPVTDAEEAARWLVIGGRRWRRTDPSLPPDLIEALKSHLGRGRSAVGAGERSGDDARVAHARRRVGLAKHGLGERGPTWWTEPEPARLARAREALAQLDALDADPTPRTGTDTDTGSDTDA